MKINDILYIVNFYGTPPLNYFEKYIKENNICKITILKLPSVRPMKNKFVVDAMYVDPDGKTHPMNLSVWFPFPMFVVYATQYLFNIFYVKYFLLKTKFKKYDIAIGETSFGSATAVMLQKTGFVKKTVYMNGDILPLLNRTEPFYFNTSTKSTMLKSIILKVDWLFIYIQHQLRKLGMQSDLIWYPNEKCRSWDEENNFPVKSFIINPQVMLDKEEVKANINAKREPATVGYIGRLDEYAGVDISIKALSKIVNSIPEIKYIIVGGGTLTVEKYKKMAIELGVENNIEFYGYIPKMADAYELLKKAKLGFSLYKPVEDNVSLFAEPSKPKEYLKLGIPVVSVNGGPTVGYDIEKYHAGVLVDYNEDSIADKVIEILKNDIEYETLRAGILTYADQCDYRSGFVSLIKRLEELSN